MNPIVKRRLMKMTAFVLVVTPMIITELTLIVLFKWLINKVSR